MRGNCISQDMEELTQESGRLAGMVRADMARFARCLSYARANLADHGQQLGQLSQLPSQVMDLTEQAASCQQAVLQTKEHLHKLALVPAEVSQVCRRVSEVAGMQSSFTATAEQADTRIAAAESRLACLDQVTVRAGLYQGL